MIPNKRRSSILKVPKAREPLSDLDFNPPTMEDDGNTRESTRGRRVSFSRKKNVAEFTSDNFTTHLTFKDDTSLLNKLENSDSHSSIFDQIKSSIQQINDDYPIQSTSTIKINATESTCDMEPTDALINNKLFNSTSIVDEDNIRRQIEELQQETTSFLPRKEAMQTVDYESITQQLTDIKNGDDCDMDITDAISTPVHIVESKRTASIPNIKIKTHLNLDLDNGHTSPNTLQKICAEKENLAFEVLDKIQAECDPAIFGITNKSNTSKNGGDFQNDKLFSTSEIFNMSSSTKKNDSTNMSVTCHIPNSHDYDFVNADMSMTHAAFNNRHSVDPLVITNMSMTCIAPPAEFDTVEIEEAPNNKTVLDDAEMSFARAIATRWDAGDNGKSIYDPLVTHLNKSIKDKTEYDIEMADVEMSMTQAWPAIEKSVHCSNMSLTHFITTDLKDTALDATTRNDMSMTRVVDKPSMVGNNNMSLTHVVTTDYIDAISNRFNISLNQPVEKPINVSMTQTNARGNMSLMHGAITDLKENATSKRIDKTLNDISMKQGIENKSCNLSFTRVVTTDYVDTTSVAEPVCSKIQKTATEISNFSTNMSLIRADDTNIKASNNSSMMRPIETLIAGGNIPNTSKVNDLKDTEPMLEAVSNKMEQFSYDMSMTQAIEKSNIAKDMSYVRGIMTDMKDATSTLKAVSSDENNKTLFDMSMTQAVQKSDIAKHMSYMRGATAEIKDATSILESVPNRTNQTLFDMSMTQAVEKLDVTKNMSSMQEAITENSDTFIKEALSRSMNKTSHDMSMTQVSKKSGITKDMSYMHGVTKDIKDATSIMEAATSENNKTLLDMSMTVADEKLDMTKNMSRMLGVTEDIKDATSTQETVLSKNNKTSFNMSMGPAVENSDIAKNMSYMLGVSKDIKDAASILEAVPSRINKTSIDMVMTQTVATLDITKNTSYIHDEMTENYDTPIGEAVSSRINKTSLVMPTTQAVAVSDASKNTSCICDEIKVSNEAVYSGMNKTSLDITTNQAAKISDVTQNMSYVHGVTKVVNDLTSTLEAAPSRINKTSFDVSITQAVEKLNAPKDKSYLYRAMTESNHSSIEEVVSSRINKISIIDISTKQDDEKSNGAGIKTDMKCSTAILEEIPSKINKSNNTSAIRDVEKSKAGSDTSYVRNKETTCVLEASRIYTTLNDKSMMRDIEKPNSDDNCDINMSCTQEGKVGSKDSTSFVGIPNKIDVTLTRVDEKSKIITVDEGVKNSKTSDIASMTFKISDPFTNLPPEDLNYVATIHDINREESPNMQIDILEPPNDFVNYNTCKENIVVDMECETNPVLNINKRHFLRNNELDSVKTALDSPLAKIRKSENPTTEPQFNRNCNETVVIRKVGDEIKIMEEPKITEQYTVMFGEISHIGTDKTFVLEHPKKSTMIHSTPQKEKREEMGNRRLTFVVKRDEFESVLESNDDCKNPPKMLLDTSPPSYIDLNHSSDCKIINVNDDNDNKIETEDKDNERESCVTKIEALIELKTKNEKTDIPFELKKTDNTAHETNLNQECDSGLQKTFAILEETDETVEKEAFTDLKMRVLQPIMIRVESIEDSIKKAVAGLSCSIEENTTTRWHIVLKKFKFNLTVDLKPFYDFPTANDLITDIEVTSIQNKIKKYDWKRISGMDKLLTDITVFHLSTEKLKKSHPTLEQLPELVEHCCSFLENLQNLSRELHQSYLLYGVTMNEKTISFKTLNTRVACTWVVRMPLDLTNEPFPSVTDVVTTELLSGSVKIEERELRAVVSRVKSLYGNSWYFIPETCTAVWNYCLKEKHMSCK